MSIWDAIRHIQTTFRNRAQAWPEHIQNADCLRRKVLLRMNLKSLNTSSLLYNFYHYPVTMLSYHTLSHRIPIKSYHHNSCSVSTIPPSNKIFAHVSHNMSSQKFNHISKLKCKVLNASKCKCTSNSTLFPCAPPPILLLDCQGLPVSQLPSYNIAHAGA
jgi:hypothetical protein